MNYSTLCSLMFTLCLILVTQSPLPTNARPHAHHRLFGDGPDLIDQICKDALHDKINCTIILRANPIIVHAKNFVQISEAILKLALNKGIEGQKFLKGLVKTKYAPAIAECANVDYDAVLRSFKSSLSEVRNDPLAANYDALIASDGVESCDRALAAARIINPTILSLNRQMSLLSYIAFLATCKLPRGNL